MLALHFSLTDTAGAPIRLVQALNRQGDWTARLVTLRCTGGFEVDLRYPLDMQQISDLANEADLIHLHNHIHLRSRVFQPVDFHALWRQGRPMVRHFHSSPETIQRETGETLDQLMEPGLPQLVIGQFQERYYPSAEVVPNLVPLQLPDYTPSSTDARMEHDLAFSHTSIEGAWNRRWDTKGAPETHRMLKRIARRKRIRYQRITCMSLRESLELRRASRILVDEMVTGSYHLSALEGLALARPVLAWMDGRCQRVFRYLSGSDINPVINNRLEDASEILDSLLDDPELCDAIGIAGRHWLSDHWSEDQMVKSYLDIYQRLLESPRLITRQRDLSLEDSVQRYFAIQLPDREHVARKSRALTPFSRIRTALMQTGFRLERYRLRKTRGSPAKFQAIPPPSQDKS